MSFQYKSQFSYQKLIENQFSYKKLIEETLSCGICKKRIEDPYICTKCLKIICKKCFEKCFQKSNRCPYCRIVMSKTDYKQFEAMQDILKFFECHGFGENQICSQHQIQYFFYCKDCNTGLCPYCMFPENIHSDHKIEKIEDCYKDFLKGIKQKTEIEAKNLEQNIEFTNQKLNNFESYKLQKQKELEAMFKKLSQELEENLTKEHSKLTTLKKNLENKKDNFSKEVKNLEEEIEQSFSPDLIQNSEKYQNKIENLVKDLESETIIKMINNSYSKDLTTLYTPDGKTEECEFDFEHGNKIGNPCKTQIVDLHGYKWNIYFYPNGEERNNNLHLSIYALPYETLPQKINTLLKFEMVNFMGNNNFSNSFEVCFQGNKTSDSYGTCSFYPINLIEKNGFVKDGKIKFKIFMKFLNF